MFDAQHAKRSEPERTPATPAQKPIEPKQGRIHRYTGDITRIPAYAQEWGNQLSSLMGNVSTTQDEAEMTIQRSAVHSVQREDASLGTRIQAATGTGHALEGTIQHTLQRGLGTDLSSVHVHTDSEADALTRSVDAIAFTTGTDMFFSAGMYNPSTSEGQHLLAHEATHVVQQATGSVAGTPIAGGISISNPNDSFEQAAETSAQSIMNGLNTATTPGSSIARKDKSEQPVSIQRKGKVYPTHKVAANKGKIDAFCDALLDAVERAYQYILHVPLLTKYATLADGRIQHWIETWQNYLSNKEAALPHAAFGYAVEALATLIYIPPEPPGMTIELQGTRHLGNAITRPDVILKQGDHDIAWLDITAEGSTNHIFNNKAGWNEQEHVAEITYDSVDLANIKTVSESSPGYDDKVDAYEFHRKLSFAKIVYDIRRKHWHQLGLSQFNKAPKADPSIRDEIRRTAILSKLSAYFEVTNDQELEKLAPSILYAMDISSEKHGFGTGTYQNRARGEIFLQNHDPNLPVLQLPRETVPRPFLPEQGLSPSLSTALVPVSSPNQPTFSFAFPDMGRGGAFPFAAFQGNMDFPFNFDTSSLGDLANMSASATGTRPQITSGATSDRNTGRDRAIRRTREFSRSLFGKPYYTRGDLAQLRRLKLPAEINSVRAILHDNQHRMFRAQFSLEGGFQFAPLPSSQATTPTLGAMSGLSPGPFLPPPSGLIPSTESSEGRLTLDAVAFDMNDGSTIYANRDVLNEPEEMEESEEME